MRHAVKSGCGGFTLIEMAIALAVAGIFAGGVMFLLGAAQRQERDDLTQANMRRVVRALATYADSAGRLPCPADPGRNDALFGWEWGVQSAALSGPRPLPDPDASPATRDTCAWWGGPTVPATESRNYGIVPFLTLGLDPESIKDGWGRYFTYAVTPVFVRNTDDVNAAAARGSVAADDQGSVHARCLDSAWMENGDNISGTKAKFCCALDGHLAPFRPGESAEDIRIGLSDGTAIWPVPGGESYDDGRDTNPARYHPVSPVAPAPIEPFVYTASLAPGVAAANGAINSIVAAPAFVLISHGDNGDGAYLGGGTRAKFSSGVVVGTGEIENGAGVTAPAFDALFVEGPASAASDATHFDDIVVWRTQDGLMAETGASSCAYP